MAKILVTGGSGFIGTNLVGTLLKQGHVVINIDVVPPRDPSQSGVWRPVDITCRDALIKQVVGFSPEFCFHLAARTDLLGKTLADYSANIEGVRNVIDALKSCPSVRYTVFASSMLVCRIGYNPSTCLDYCPSTVYGQSKVIGEKMVREIGDAHFPWTIVRPTSIWGPWFASPYRDFFTMVERHFYFHPGNVLVQRNYGFVFNTINQLVSLMGSDLMYFKTSYLADPDPINLKKWADAISMEFHGVKVHRLPLPIFKLLALIGDGLAALGVNKFPMTSFRLNNMLTPALYSVNELSEVSGPPQYSVEEGVKITCQWIRSQ